VCPGSEPPPPELLPPELPLRVLVVDDHPIWRDGVAAGLEDADCVIAGTAAEGAQALRVAAATRPQVVLLDLNLPDMSGAEVTRQLLAADPSVRVLILSASGERQDVLDAITAGATGYLVKSAQFSELLSAVRATAAGEAVFTPGLAGLVLGEYRRLAAVASSPVPPSAPVTARAPLPPGTGPVDRIPLTPRLTEREMEVLRLVAKGLTYPEIAGKLVLSPRTVQNHVQNTLVKLQLHNKAQLVRYALEQGIG
jgi:DNA-binding NarL/FixJ family response regulator